MIVANLRDGGDGLAAKVTLAMGAAALAAAAVVMTNGLSSERMTLRAAMHRRHGSAKVKDDMRNQQGVSHLQRSYDKTRYYVSEKTESQRISRKRHDIG